MSSQKMKDGDPRFLRVQKDPRFWEMPERDRKISIDKRFRSMFHDQRFKVKQTVDKRGRPVSHSTAEDLRRFYQLSDSDEEEGEEEGRTKMPILYQKHVCYFEKTVIKCSNSVYLMITMLSTAVVSHT
uniref:ESF1 homolog n=1 Tax=Oryzias sinensis TaxID=183150 RepID=A0A8C8DGD9_9TELE